MYKGIYKIAEKNIEIISLHKLVHTMCKDYVSNEKPDFIVKISQEEIDNERKINDLYKEKRILNEKNTTRYADSNLETLAVYRQIAEKMLDFNTILFHSSVVAVDGEAYVFTAKSGTGKSTHTRLWREYFGNRAVMVNDDKPLLIVKENQVLACGTPWNGKHHLGENIIVPVKAICILKRSQNNYIKPADKEEIAKALIKQAYTNYKSEKILKMLNLIDIISKNVEIFDLGCNMDISAAATAYNGINEINL